MSEAVSYTHLKVEGDVGENREQIVNAFKSAGFSLRTDEDGVMTFRADGLLRKLTLLGDCLLYTSRCV